MRGGGAVGVSGGVEGEPQSSLTVIAKSPRKQFLNILCIIRSKDGFISTQLSILRGYETATRFMDCQAVVPRLLRPAFKILFGFLRLLYTPFRFCVCNWCYAFLHCF